MDRDREGLRGRQARVELVVDEQAPHVAEGDLADEVLDVDAPVAQDAAVTVGLGDLGLECDDALKSGDELGHGVLPGSAAAPIQHRSRIHGVIGA